MSSIPNDRGGSSWSFIQNANLLLFICRAWATSIEVFLHRDFGSRYLGWQAVSVLLLVPLYGLFWEGYDVRPLMWFIPAYLLMCLCARIEMFRRWKRGESCHSLYSGWPTMVGPKTKFSELTCKRFVEPGLILVFGWWLRHMGEAPLGSYLMTAAVCLFISVNATIMFDRLRVLNMNDAVIDQQIIAERFREMRGNQ